VTGTPTGEPTEQTAFSEESMGSAEPPLRGDRVPGLARDRFPLVSMTDTDDPPATDYLLRVVPPGESFNIGVMYETHGSSPSQSDDQVAGAVDEISYDDVSRAWTISE
jgi:hypothetical protein